MRLRILVKALIIGLAIVVAGWTTMIWYSVSTKKAAGEDDAETKPIVTVNKSEAGNSIITNWNPANKNNALFYVLDTGTETPYLRAEYADQLTYIPFELTAFTPAAEIGFWRIFGNPPARAAPEPRGPL